MPAIEPNWHPVVVHFVIALLSVSALLFAVAAFGPAARRDGARTAADWTLALGMAALAAGVAAGFYAYYTVAHDGPSHAAMTGHRNLALAAAAAFVAFAAWRFLTRGRAPNALFAIAGLAAAALLLAAAYRGGTVVYEHGVGVQRLPEAGSGDGHDHDHGAAGHDDGAAAPAQEHEHADGVADEHEHADPETHDAAPDEAPDAAPEAAAASENVHLHDDGTAHVHDAEAPEAVAEDAPEAAVAGFHAALQAGDADAARAFLADDVVILEGGGAERSLAEYASHHLGADMAYLENVETTVVRRDAYESGDAAWVVTEGRQTGSYNGRAIDSASLETMILRRAGGVWRIVHIHWS